MKNEKMKENENEKMKEKKNEKMKKNNEKRKKNEKNGFRRKILYDFQGLPLLL